MVDVSENPDTEEKVIEAEVPVGLLHPFMLEPFRVRFFLDDEIVTDCEISFDPPHRGIERLLEGIPIERANIITERI